MFSADRIAVPPVTPARSALPYSAAPRPLIRLFDIHKSGFEIPFSTC
jgi:hypothetical protein